MEHSNVLGTFIIPLSCAALGLAVYNSMHRWKVVCYCALAGGFICEILTISRGAIAFWSVSILALSLMLLFKSNKINNFPYAAIALLLVSMMLFKSVDSLSQRFSQNTSADYSLREQYNYEAKSMAEEHFWGVGMGNFSAWSWHRYAKMTPNRTESPGVPAHSMWFLTLGELGYLGLLALILIWVRYLFLVLKLFVKKLSYYHYTWLSISLSGIIGVLLQESLNNCYRHTSIYFMVQFFTAIPIAIYYLNREEKPSKEENSN